MGMNAFLTVGHGQNVDETFFQTVAKSKLDDGYCYSGEVGMKKSYIVISKTEVGTQNPFKYANKLFYDARITKYGPAGIIEITGEHMEKYRKVHNLVGKKIKAYIIFGWACI